MPIKDPIMPNGLADLNQGKKKENPDVEKIFLEIESQEVLKNKDEFVKKAAETFLLPDNEGKDLSRIARDIYLAEIEQDEQLYQETRNFLKKYVEDIYKKGKRLDDFIEQQKSKGISAGDAYKMYNGSDLEKSEKIIERKNLLEYYRSLGLDEYLIQEKIPELKKESASQEISAGLTEKEFIFDNIGEISELITPANKSGKGFVDYVSKKRGITIEEAKRIVKPKLRIRGLDQEVVDYGVKKLGIHPQLSHAIKNAGLKYAMLLYEIRFSNLNDFESYKKVYYLYLESLGVDTSV